MKKIMLSRALQNAALIVVGVFAANKNYWASGFCFLLFLLLLAIEVYLTLNYQPE